ncbi:hypothetical protein BU15DRAFT_69160 [Melanogaster broomeanus]|nr:hypothetical protein BU15DRAFT_69160 [Melanogaster broomeanus]
MVAWGAGVGCMCMCAALSVISRSPGWWRTSGCGPETNVRDGDEDSGLMRGESQRMIVVAAKVMQEIVADGSGLRRGDHGNGLTLTLVEGTGTGNGTRIVPYPYPSVPVPLTRAGYPYTVLIA